MNILLSTSYFGPIHYYANICDAGEVFLEGFEHFPKQTYRNRCCIYSANGPLTLSIPVTKGNAHKIYTREIRIDYSYAWQKNHLRAIESAYRCSPYYLYYMDEIAPFFHHKFDFLIDLNSSILVKTCSLLGLAVKIRNTESFQKIGSGDMIDLRFAIHPKAQKNEYEPSFPTHIYQQVFDPKFGFIDNLSIIDLLFNTGPDAIQFLKP